MSENEKQGVQEPTELVLVRQENLTLAKQVEVLKDRLTIAERERKHLTGLTGRLVSDQAVQNRRNLSVDWRTKQFIESEMPQARIEVRVVSAAFAIAHLVPFKPAQDNDENVEFHLALRRLMEVRTGRAIPLTKVDAENEMLPMLRSADWKPKKSYEEYLEEGLKEPPARL
jgi:hypothetical protein